MKKFLSVIALSALLLALPACGGGEQAPFDPAADSVQELLTSAAFTEALTQMDQAVACARYGVDDATVTTSAIYGSTGATAEELAVLAFDSEDAAQEAYTAVGYWLEDRKEELEDYLPGEISKLDNAVLEVRGTSLLLAVAADYGPVDAFREG